MTEYQLWAARHPQAAAELQQLLNAAAHYHPESQPTHSEARVQQAVRMEIARRGGLAWRNNVGASPTKEKHVCPVCHFAFEVKKDALRWGICNDSAKLNEQLKSPDLIGVVPLLITPQMVGSVIGQFRGWEVKESGWHFNPKDPHECAQLAFGTLLEGKGAGFEFTTGGLKPW